MTRRVALDVRIERILIERHRRENPGRDSPDFQVERRKCGLSGRRTLPAVSSGKNPAG
jgi:hypothetical protein